MPPHLPRRAALLAPLLASLPASAQAPTVTLFRVVTARDEVLIGLTPAELAALGGGAEVERVARRLVEAGQITAWRYTVTRAADGSTQLATRERVALLRHDSLRVEPYRPALPVAPPPS